MKDLELPLMSAMKALMAACSSTMERKEAWVGELGEQTLDGVRPRGRGGRDVEHETRMAATDAFRRRSVGSSAVRRAGECPPDSVVVPGARTAGQTARRRSRLEADVLCDDL